jgi:hypothetical protein
MDGMVYTEEVIVYAFGHVKVLEQVVQLARYHQEACLVSISCLGLVSYDAIQFAFYHLEVFSIIIVCHRFPFCDSYQFAVQFSKELLTFVIVSR